MIARRKSPIAAAAPMTAARITPIDWAMVPTRLVPALYGPAYHAQKTPTTKPPTRSPTPILRLFPLPKYAVKAPVITRKSAKVKSKMVTNVNRSNASNGIDVLLKIDACQGLRVDDAWDRSDLVDDDLTEDIEILGLDFRDQVVLSEQGVELHDFLHFEELIVHFVLLRRSSANEHEPDGHP